MSITTPDKILAFANKHPTFKVRDLIPILKISRQTIAEHLRRMVNQGKLIKTGSTHNATYQLKGRNDRAPTTTGLKLIRKLTGLEEDRVFDEIRNRMTLKKYLSQNVLSIAYYSFCEMLNNSIDHSKSEKATTEVELKDGYYHFKIRDFGIGIFKNVQTKFRLQSEYEAAEHLLKGKQTTMPERHSGQGIFFTSRIADQFSLYSHKLRVLVDNELDDAYFADMKFIRGTQVEFKIKQRSRKKLQELFSKFSDESTNFEFNKNVLRVRLRSDRELVSRSQARRLLMGLEEFEILVFDFKDIPGIGQAFADEVFRVYANANPSKKLTYENAGPIVEFMLKRAQVVK